MKNISIFETEGFDKVRTLINEKEEILFCAKDVATNLGYTNHKKAIRTHCKKTSDYFFDTATGEKSLNFIPESDVYRLIIKSKLPTAEKFEVWLFEEVLPSIRKTGAYMTPSTITELLQKPESITELLQMLVNETQEKQKLEQEIEVTKPKVEYYDQLIETSSLINFTTTAKELGLRPKDFISYLLDNGYVFRNTKKIINPYQVYVKRDYFEIKEFCRNGHHGTQTLLTAKGRSYFLKKFNVKSTKQLDDFEEEQQLMLE